MAHNAAAPENGQSRAKRAGRGSYRKDSGMATAHGSLRPSKKVFDASAEEGWPSTVAW